jgi:uncharacterized protein (TIGR02453 family)
MSQFAGFPKQTLTFLRRLARNNAKEWFDAHRSDYEQYWVEPAKGFAAAAGEALGAIAPAIRAEPRINGSIFRINRDIRFSPDKRPYKDHLDFWFWEGERKTAVSGFYLRITPSIIGIGVGAHRFGKDRLAAFRDAVVDDASGPALATTVKSMQRKGFEIRGEHYKRIPPGYEPANGMEERLLRHAALWIGEDRPVPAELHEPTFVKYATAEWKRMAPLHRWLVDTLQD